MPGAYRDLLLEHVGVEEGLRVSELRDALEWLAGVIAGPVTEPVPALSPSTWSSMRCRVDGSPVPEEMTALLTDHRCCRCEHCRWQARWRPVVANWEVSQSHRPHRVYAHPYGSLGAALADLMRHRLDGAGVRSSTGALADRQTAVAALGCAVQTTARHDRDTADIRRVDLVLDVERCVVASSSHEDVRGSVSTGAAMGALLASVSAAGLDEEACAARLEVTAATVRGVVRRGRRRVTVDLAARGLIPEPRTKARLGAEIAARRVELGR